MRQENAVDWKQQITEWLGTEDAYSRREKIKICIEDRIKETINKRVKEKQPLRNILIHIPNVFPRESEQESLYTLFPEARKGDVEVVLGEVIQELSEDDRVRISKHSWWSTTEFRVYSYYLLDIIAPKQLIDKRGIAI